MKQLTLGFDVPVFNRAVAMEFMDHQKRPHRRRLRRPFGSWKEVKVGARVWVTGDDMPAEEPGIITEKPWDSERYQYAAIVRLDRESAPPYTCDRLAHLRPADKETGQ